MAQKASDLDMGEVERRVRAAAYKLNMDMAQGGYNSDGGAGDLMTILAVWKVGLAGGVPPQIVALLSGDPDRPQAPAMELGPESTVPLVDWMRGGPEPADPRKNEVIHKYAIDPDVQTEVLMPATAEVLAVQVQRGRVVLWARHREAQSKPTIRRAFVCIGTGHSFNNTTKKMAYCGTVQAGEFVWHVFEKKA